MRYYIIPEGLAKNLSLTSYRKGNARLGYLVNQSDLASYGVERALAEGAREIEEKRAGVFLAELNN